MKRNNNLAVAAILNMVNKIEDEIDRGWFEKDPHYKENMINVIESLKDTVKLLDKIDEAANKGR